MLCVLQDLPPNPGTPGLPDASKDSPDVVKTAPCFPVMPNERCVAGSPATAASMRMLVHTPVWVLRVREGVCSAQLADYDGHILAIYGFFWNKSAAICCYPFIARSVDLLQECAASAHP